MRSESFERVRKFQKAMGHPCPDAPAKPEHGIRLALARCVAEEASELVRALGFEMNSSITVSNDPLDSSLHPADQIVEVAHEAADTHAAVLGVLASFGVDDVELFKSVEDANLRKVANGCTFGVDGKVVKPKDWDPPDIDDVINDLLLPF